MIKIFNKSYIIISYVVLLGCVTSTESGQFVEDVAIFGNLEYLFLSIGGFYVISFLVGRISD